MEEENKNCSDMDIGSGSETHDAQSETSEDESEIDLLEIDRLEIDTNKDFSKKTSFSFRSGMIWFSIPSHPRKTKFSSAATEKSGVTEFTKNITSIEDVFLCFVSVEMLNKIMVYSNMEGERNKASDDEWEAITLIELKAFIGLLLLAGLMGKSKKSIKSLWNRNPLESPIFRATMSRNRFETILSTIRFDNKITREERKQTDKFAAFREIWSDFRENSKKCYSPGLCITIDEQLLGFRGKCPFRQYIPSKPDKYGIKFWLCVDVDSYYVFDAFPYVGRQPNEQRQHFVGANVGLELMKLMYGSNRNVTIDNFFTSIPLAKELHTKKLTLDEAEVEEKTSNNVANESVSSDADATTTTTTDDKELIPKVVEHASSMIVETKEIELEKPFQSASAHLCSNSCEKKLLRNPKNETATTNKLLEWEPLIKKSHHASSNKTTPTTTQSNVIIEMTTKEDDEDEDEDDDDDDDDDDAENTNAFNLEAIRNDNEKEPSFALLDILKQNKNNLEELYNIERDYKLKKIDAYDQLAKIRRKIRRRTKRNKAKNTETTTTQSEDEEKETEIYYIEEYDRQKRRLRLVTKAIALAKKHSK
ncbi:unnamed protein product [Adineta steineri]|uniref:PiggyBac transposable element-derived protein domain-containing protein n=1 Tax=Adineta steineri TaxID=433720 RepID=A0A819K352_9BILA|nr:unnamed protein product [Adineta steineri]